MNKKGHVSTLITAHPGNRNAVKAGVFSRATLAPRIYELEASMAERPAREVANELLRRELASLAALGEAMDQSLAEEGIHGRRGEPRSLVNLRLRLTQKLLQTIDQYARLHNEGQPGTNERTSLEASQEPPPLHATFLESIAALHDRESIDAIPPHDLDVEVYLRCVIITTDTTVTTEERTRARRILISRRKARPLTCLCFSTLKAQSDLQIREWLDEMHEAGVEVSPDDPLLAALVRQVARGERLEPDLRKTQEAIREVVAARTNRTRELPHPGGRKIRKVDAPFWQIVLSPDTTVTAKERLQALVILIEADVLDKCTCKPISDERIEPAADTWAAYTIRLATKRHYRAAMHIARYPETYLAIRDSIDAKLISEKSILDGHH